MLLLTDDLLIVSRLREGQYTAQDGTQLYVQDDQTVEDVRDLYQVLSWLDDTGSPNPENGVVLSMLHDVEGGGLLSAAQLGKFLDLMARHGDEVAALRRDRDVAPTHMPSPEDARILSRGGNP